MAQSAEELKAQLKELSARRARLEQDIAVRTARLEAAGVGMSGSLVDREVRGLALITSLPVCMIWV